MKRFSFYIFLCSLLALASCEHDGMSVTKIAGDGFTLTGNSTIGTKTSFGTPESGSIPFLWEAGDCIYVNGFTSEALNEGGTTVEFIFTEGSVKAGDAVYYGVVDFERNPGSCQALICPWQSGDSKDLYYNCDFGYAIVGEDNSFELEHYSSYLWLNTFSKEVTRKVAAVKIYAQNDIVGWREFDGSARKFVGSVLPMIPVEDVTVPEDEILAQTKFILLNFQDDNYEAAPKQLPAESSDEEFWAVAVTLPVGSTGSLTVEYIFEDGTCASYNYPSRELVAGTTYRITQEIKAADLYSLRTLTFEDEPGSTYWAELIPGEDEQAYGVSSLIYFLSEPYCWMDENTQLSHEFPFNWNTYDFAGGGHVVSSHCGTMEDLGDTYDIYNYQLSIPLSAGHNNSDNFCIGYHDSSIELDDEVKPAIFFNDGKARVIDHMYITNASVTMFCMLNGNSFCQAFDEDDHMDVVATGYVGDEKVGSLKFRLAEGADMMVTDWVKWDLSPLGAVTKVVFHMEEVQIGYDLWWCTPMYFAYDDVAVRFSIDE